MESRARQSSAFDTGQLQHHPIEIEFPRTKLSCPAFTSGNRRANSNQTVPCPPCFSSVAVTGLDTGIFQRARRWKNSRDADRYNFHGNEPRLLPFSYHSTPTLRCSAEEEKKKNENYDCGKSSRLNPLRVVHEMNLVTLHEKE